MHDRRHSLGEQARHEHARRAPAPVFFAPAQVQKRSKDWGPAELQKRLAAAWGSFRASTDKWLEVERGYGSEAVERAFADVKDGRTPPSKGLVLSMWGSPEEAAGR